MNTSKSTPNLLDISGTLTPSGMLGHLIDLLIHPNDNTTSWLGEMLVPTIGPHGATERLSVFASCAARANVARALTLRMLTAIVKAEGWAVGRETIEELVDFIYEHHLKKRAEENQTEETQTPTK